MVNYYKAVLFILSAGFLGQANAQIHYHNSDSIVFRTAAKVLGDALNGGIQTPLFSRTDLNGDNKKDLVIFDKFDSKVLTYKNVGTASNPVYKYEPKYEPYFPKFKPKGWMLMRDFNKDGYEDIFTSDGVVYKNVSYTVSERPAFERLPVLMYRNIFPDNSPITYNILAPTDVHLPGIADIDFDGDIDIITYTNVGGAITFYKNEQVEKGLPPDSMRFRYVDMCWGNFRDSGSTTIGVMLNQFDPNEKFYKKRHTSGSSLTPLDLNNDGDMDLLMGNSVAKHIIMLENGRADNNGTTDSIIAFDSTYPDNTARMQILMYPAGYYEDVDGDGNRDILLSTYGTVLTRETRQISYYKNTGADLAPVFSFVQDDFLCDNMIDHGRHTMPAFWDYDGDGDKDLFVATNGDYITTGDLADRLVLYKNTGTASQAVFQLEDLDFAGFSSYKIVGMAPFFEDINGDGLTDLLIGNDAGVIRYYKNTSSSATTTSPTFSFSNPSYVSIDNIDVGMFSAPCVADLNKDGKKDLLVGALNGDIYYYENTGTVTAPVFTKRSSRLGMIRVADSVGITNEKYDYDTAGNPILIDYDVYYDPTPYATPVVTDLNLDGRYEILCGLSSGTLKAWTVTDNLLSDSFPSIDNFYDQQGIQGEYFYNQDFGYRTAPAVANIAGGDRPEIILGNNRGGLNLLTPDKYLGVDEPSVSALQFKLYPNPSSGSFTVTLPASGGKSVLSVYNTLGQLLLQKNFAEGESSLDTDMSALGNGIYIITVHSGNLPFRSQQLVIMH